MPLTRCERERGKRGGRKAGGVAKANLTTRICGQGLSIFCALALTAKAQKPSTLLMHKLDEERGNFQQVHNVLSYTIYVY